MFGVMSKYLYMMTTKIDDVAPRQQKPPKNPATSAKSLQKPPKGVNRTVSIVHRCLIRDFVVEG
jgi:hypothetical protein